MQVNVLEPKICSGNNKSIMVMIFPEQFALEAKKLLWKYHFPLKLISIFINLLHLLKLQSMCTNGGSCMHDHDHDRTTLLLSHYIQTMYLSSLFIHQSSLRSCINFTVYIYQFMHNGAVPDFPVIWQQHAKIRNNIERRQVALG